MHSCISERQDNPDAWLQEIRHLDGYSNSVPIETERIHKIFHVKYAMPVLLTDYRTTESMGVGVKSFRCEPDKLSQVEFEEKLMTEKLCKKAGNKWLVRYPLKKNPNKLPDNRSQAVKRLESIELGLIKNLKHAEAYDKQMTEMNDMNYSRKLSEEVITNYKGPVPYVSHHEVPRPEKTNTPLRILFNSSAIYQGHSLNDYLFKGPYLLNSLSGVILRLRENEVAISGDISKMYHQVLIPQEDQQVHRFLWRNLDTTRPPDTYVKTVLTFGDKPASAIGQIAQKITMKEGENESERAAAAVPDNSYMDDIYDTVHTTGDARQWIIPLLN